MDGKQRVSGWRIVWALIVFGVLMLILTHQHP